MPAHTLVSDYDGVICDLDGVVYRGPAAIPGAIESLNTVAGTLRLSFATNNASRPPSDVADHLVSLGLRRGDWTVATSSEAAATYVLHRYGAGAPVLAVGGPGVVAALRAAGLTPLRVPELRAPGAGSPGVVAVVQGLGTEVTWQELATVARLAERGVTWVATNMDITLPTADGPAPGNGALVAVVRTATTAEPVVTGKPGDALFELARVRMGTERRRTLVVGDRLDTDIAGAVGAGLDSLLVLTGASTLRDLATAPPPLRPTYVSGSIAGLLAPVVRLRAEPAGADVSSDGTISVNGAAPGPALIGAVVSSAWDATDNGLGLSSDEGMWRELERRLGLG